MDEADSILLDEEKKSKDGGTASQATKEKVRKAQDQLWHSHNRFMWILGDRKTVAWIKVKEEGNPTPNFRWIKIDEDAHLKILFSELDKECKKQKLEYSSSSMHQYESRGVWV